MKTKNNEKAVFQNRLLSEKEAAAFLGLSPITLRQQRSRGTAPGSVVEIPFIKLGDKAIRYALSDLYAVVAAQRVGG